MLAKGTSVNVTDGDEVFIGTVTGAPRKGKCRVEFDDDTAKWYPVSAIVERKRGRRAITEVLGEGELKAEVDLLLAQLRGAKNDEDKKSLRRMLRRRGHRGGLGIRGAKKEAVA